MNTNFDDVNQAEVVAQAPNATETSNADLAVASRKLNSAKQSPQSFRKSANTEVTTSKNKEEVCGSPKSDKGPDASSSPLSSKGSKKRKIEEISNSDNVQTFAVSSCGESVDEAHLGGSRKRLKMNDGEAHNSPSKTAQSPKAQSEGSKMSDHKSADSKLASKYLKDSASSTGGTKKQQIDALDLQELKDALPAVPSGDCGEVHNTSLNEQLPVTDA